MIRTRDSALSSTILNVCFILESLSSFVDKRNFIIVNVDSDKKDDDERNFDVFGSIHSRLFSRRRGLLGNTMCGSGADHPPVQSRCV